MSVVRRGIIELELRAKQQRLESPQIDAAAKAYKEVEKSHKEIERTIERTHTEIHKSVEKSTVLVREFGVQSVNSFREAGEGVFRMTRGLALLSASGSDDLQRLIRQVALAQAAFDIFAGSSKVFTSLAGVLGGPVTLAVTGLTAALGAGAIAWQRQRAEAERFEKAGREVMDGVRKRIELANQEANRLADRFGRVFGQAGAFRDRLAEMRAEAGLPPEQRGAALAASRSEEIARISGRFEEFERGFRRRNPAASAMLDFQGATTMEALREIRFRPDDQRRLVALGERQRDLLEKQFDFQRDQRDEFRTQSALAATASVGVQLGGVAGTFGGLGPAAALAQPLQEIARQNAQAVSDATEGLRRIAGAIEQVGLLVIKLRDDLDSANTR
jgi:hypothetical protein